MRENLTHATMLSACICVLLLSGCASTVIDTATDVVIAVAKVPFKVGGAVVDVATDDDD